MSLSERTPAIYKITNLIDGRVYIGSTKNVTKRFKQYISAVERYKKDGYRHKSTNTLIIDIATLGWDNFEFKIVESGPEMFDPDIRSITEVEYIMKYRSIHPKYGYNATMGGETGSVGHRKYINRKPKPVFLYDTTTGEIDLYLTGTKTIPKELHIPKERLPDALQRGKLLKNRYFIFYADPQYRASIAELKSEQCLVFSTNGDNDRDSMKRYDLYFEALKKVNEFAENRGF